MSYTPIEQVRKELETMEPSNIVPYLLVRISERDDLIQRMSVYAGGGHQSDIAGRLEAIDASIKLLAGHATSMKTELLAIKALLAEKEKRG